MAPILCFSNPNLISVFLILTLHITLFSFKCQAQFGLPRLSPDTTKLSLANEMEVAAIRAKDSVLLGKAYLLFAETYSVCGQKTTASDYALRTIRTLEPRGDFFETGKAYLILNLGVQFEDAVIEPMERSLKALSIFQKIKSDYGIALAYNFLTSNYKMIWFWDRSEIENSKRDSARIRKVMHCMDNIAYYGKRANSGSLQAEAELQRADFCRSMGDKKAFPHFENALNLFRVAKNDSGVIHTLAHMSNAYLLWGDTRNATKTIDEALEIARSRKLNDYWANAHVMEAARDHYERTGQWKLAFDAMVALHYYYTFRQEGDYHLSNSIKLKHEAERKDALLQAQTSELDRLRVQRRFNVAMGALLVVTIGTSFFLFRLSRKNQRISRKNEKLVAEQNHRVKNNLQVVSSLLQLQADQLTDEYARQAIEESQLRIQSMAILHQRLYDGEQLAKVNLEDFITELIAQVFQTFGVSQVEINVDIPSIYLSADKATPLGLIVNELLTNACKYAFPGNPAPTISIDARQAGNRITVVVADNGPGLPETQVTRFPQAALLRNNNATFGIQLIQSQASQLSAVYHFENGGTTAGYGVRFTLEFSV